MMSDRLRIVSLVPSLTEAICRLGFTSDIVGCTSFCVDPPQLIKHVVSIGGTKTPDLDKIAQLKPTHILTNDEENTATHIKGCEAIAPTFRCLPKGPQDVPKLLEDLKLFLGSCIASETLQVDKHTRSIRTALAALAAFPPEQKTFLYLIWRNPWMAAGPDTYISKSLELLGWKNGLSVSLGRYPILTRDILEHLKVDLVLTSSEPYPFRKRDVEALRGDWQDCPSVWWCDGKILSWFGTMTEDLLKEMILFKTGRAHKLFKPR